MHLKSDYRIVMNHKKIKRIMRKYDLITKVRKRNPYKAIMKKTSEHRTFKNILNRDFKQAIPRKILCTDITYLYYAKGRKAYLSVVKDIATREILSYRLSNNLSMRFVLDSINNLQDKDIIREKTLIHSDQGTHYTSPEYIIKVKELNLIQSMSRRGNCVDNAPIESFFGHLKDEIDLKQIMTFEELNDTIKSYMEYYNNKRYQWGLKKMTPVEYRNHLLSSNT